MWEEAWDGQRAAITLGWAVTGVSEERPEEAQLEEEQGAELAEESLVGVAEAQAAEVYEAHASDRSARKDLYTSIIQKELASIRRG